LVVKCVECKMESSSLDHNVDYYCSSYREFLEHFVKEPNIREHIVSLMSQHSTRDTTLAFFDMMDHSLEIGSRLKDESEAFEWHLKWADYGLLSFKDPERLLTQGKWKLLKDYAEFIREEYHKAGLLGRMLEGDTLKIMTIRELSDKLPVGARAVFQVGSVSKENIHQWPRHILRQVSEVLYQGGPVEVPYRDIGLVKFNPEFHNPVFH